MSNLEVATTQAVEEFFNTLLKEGMYKDTPLYTISRGNREEYKVKTYISTSNGELATKLKELVADDWTKWYDNTPPVQARLFGRSNLNYTGIAHYWEFHIDDWYLNQSIDDLIAARDKAIADKAARAKAAQKEIESHPDYNPFY